MGIYGALEVLSEATKNIKPTEDEILDLEEDHNLRCGKKFISVALSIHKEFPNKFKEDDVVKWCKAGGGKGELPNDVVKFLQGVKRDEDNAKFQKKWDKESAASNKPPKGAYTDEQMEKQCKLVAKDWQADNKGGDMTLDQVAYDLADSFMYPGSDPKAYAWVQWKLKLGMSKDAVKGWLADSM